MFVILSFQEKTLSSLYNLGQIQIACIQSKVLSPHRHLAIGGKGIKFLSPHRHLAIAGTSIKFLSPRRHLAIAGTSIKFLSPHSHLAIGDES